MSLVVHDVDALVDAIARRMLELLAEQAGDDRGGELVWSTGQVARELGRSEEWVRDHRAELGVLPAAGPRPRLLFDAAAVRAWATARSPSVRSGARDPAPGGGSRGAGQRRLSSGRVAVHAEAELLPIRGEGAA